MDPTGAQVGANSSCWAEWAQSDPDGLQIEWKPNSVLTCRNLAPLATASHQVGLKHGEHCFKRSVIDSKKNVENNREKRHLQISGWASSAPHVEAIWTSIWAKVMLLPNGFKLGPSCAILEPSWARVALLVEVDPKSGQCCGHVGWKRCIWAILCQYAKCASFSGGVRS